MSRIHLRVAVAGVVLFASLAAGLAAGTLSARAAAPVARASPHRKLINGQTIMMSGAHFPPGDQLVIDQCNKTVWQTMSSASCNVANLVFVTSDATGAVAATRFTVVAGKVGNGTCDKANACFVFIGEIKVTGGIFAGAKVTFR